MTELVVVAEEGPIIITFDDLVRYHGHGALAMLAITFRAQEVALQRLCGVVAPKRQDISVVSGHPGPGVRDAFEMVTRCLTRGKYTINQDLAGPRLNAATNVVYAYRIAVNGKGAIHVAIREGVLPDAFFDHLNAPSTNADLAAGAKLRRQIAATVLEVPDPEEMFVCTAENSSL